jgi:hypothetical protein
MSAAVQLEVFTWHAVAPTMGTSRLSLIIPVTTVPCAAERTETAVSRATAQSRADSILIPLLYLLLLLAGICNRRQILQYVI